MPKKPITFTKEAAYNAKQAAGRIFYALPPEAQEKKNRDRQTLRDFLVAAGSAAPDQADQRPSTSE